MTRVDLVRPQRPEDALDVLGFRRLPDHQLDSEPLGGGLRLGQQILVVRVLRVHEREDALDTGDQEREVLEVLRDEVACAEDAGQIRPRVGEALDQAVPDRIVRVEEDDRGLGLCRRLLRSGDRLVLEGHDHVDALADEHLGLNVGGRLVQVPPHELDVLASEVAALPLLLQAQGDIGIRQVPPELLFELRGQPAEGRRHVVESHVHEPDARDVLRGRAVAVRARAGGENGCDQDGAAERECAASHLCGS